MKTKNSYKNIRMSPKKLRFLLDSIRPLRPSDAVIFLTHTRGKSAKILSKLIASAIADSKRVLKTEEDMLQFKLLSVDEGPKLKRYKAGGRGTAAPIKRRFAHINIVLTLVKTASPVSVQKEKSKKLVVRKTKKE